MQTPIATSSLLLLSYPTQPHPQAPPRFYPVAVEKNREKAWDHRYVTGRKWWTRLVQTKRQQALSSDRKLGGAWVRGQVFTIFGNKPRNSTWFTKLFHAGGVHDFGTRLFAVYHPVKRVFLTQVGGYVFKVWLHSGGLQYFVMSQHL